MLSRVMENISCYNSDMLREVMVKIGLERIDTQKRVIVISLEFGRKQGFKLKKINRPIYVRNVNSYFNKEEFIKYMVKVNIYYQRHKERMKISSQKWSVILEMLWLACHNPKIDWRTGKINIIRCLDKYGKQQEQKLGQ